MEPLLHRTAPLTEYAWKFRCPGDPEEASAQEAAEALDTAREVFETILSHLPPEVAP